MDRGGRAMTRRADAGRTELLSLRVLPCPSSFVLELLTHRPEDWLRPFVRVASERGDVIGTRLRAPVAGSSGSTGIAVSKRVAMTLGQPERVCRADTELATIPVRWEALGYSVLFPVFAGAFIVRALTTDRTEVMLVGSYDPPAGRLGDLFDRIIAHRAAEACVDNLLTNIAAAVEEVVGWRSERAP